MAGRYGVKRLSANSMSMGVKIPSQITRIADAVTEPAVVSKLMLSRLCKGLPHPLMT